MNSQKPPIQDLADSNRLLHKLMHPMLKFGGTAQLLQQMAGLLKYTVADGPGDPAESGSRERAQALVTQLQGLKNHLGEKRQRIAGDIRKLAVVDDLLIQLTRFINGLANSLKSDGDAPLLDAKVRDTAMWAQEADTDNSLLGVQTRDTAIWTLDELEKACNTGGFTLAQLVPQEFISHIQNLLLGYMARGSQLIRSEARILERETDALRTHMGSKERRKYTFRKQDVGTIVVANLESFAPVLAERNIEIQYKTPRGNLVAEISKTDVDRMVCNLLHNARQYSYASRARKRIVKVVAREIQPGDMVEIAIESFGSPITAEEIENGNIYKPGYRGRFGHERYIEGTGIGLADSKAVADAHKGTITIQSHPSTHDGDPPQYKVPYLTKVIVRLPKKRPD